MGGTSYGYYENHGHVRTKGYNLSLLYSFSRWFDIGGTFNSIDTRDYEKFLAGSSLQESMHYKVRMPNLPYRYANINANFYWNDLFVKGNVLSIGYDSYWQHDFPLYWENLGDKDSKNMVPEQFSHNLSLSYTMKNGRYNVSLNVGISPMPNCLTILVCKKRGAHSMESSECFSVNNKSKFLVSINNKEYMKKFLLQAFAIAFCLSSGVFVASCDDDNNPVDNPPIDGETAYVVAATTGEASYLVVANSLDEGTVSTQGNGTEVIGGTYWVYKGLDYVFALVYNKGGAGTGASYYLGADGKMKEKYTYTYNRITSYGTWGDKVVTVSTGDSK